MKSLNFQKLNISGADVLTRLQMKKIVGGHGDGATCTYTYTGSNGSGSSRTCDYHVECSSGVNRNLL
jgi:natural product precursor